MASHRNHHLSRHHASNDFTVSVCESRIATAYAIFAWIKKRCVRIRAFFVLCILPYAESSRAPRASSRSASSCVGKRKHLESFVGFIYSRDGWSKRMFSFFFYGCHFWDHCRMENCHWGQFWVFLGALSTPSFLNQSLKQFCGQCLPFNMISLWSFAHDTNRHNCIT